MRSLDLALSRIYAATADVAGASRRVTEQVTTAAVTFSENTRTAVAALSRATMLISIAMVAVAIVAITALFRASR